MKSTTMHSGQVDIFINLETTKPDPLAYSIDLYNCRKRLIHGLRMCIFEATEQHWQLIYDFSGKIIASFTFVIAVACLYIS